MTIEKNLIQAVKYITQKAYIIDVILIKISWNVSVIIRLQLSIHFEIILFALQLPNDSILLLSSFKNLAKYVSDKANLIFARDIENA